MRRQFFQHQWSELPIVGPPNTIRSLFQSPAQLQSIAKQFIHLLTLLLTVLTIAATTVLSQDAAALKAAPPRSPLVAEPVETRATELKPGQAAEIKVRTGATDTYSVSLRA